MFWKASEKKLERSGKEGWPAAPILCSVALCWMAGVVEGRRGDLCGAISALLDKFKEDRKVKLWLRP